MNSINRKCATPGCMQRLSRLREATICALCSGRLEARFAAEDALGDAAALSTPLHSTVALWDEGERRMEQIGPNGPTGEHYTATAAGILRAGLRHMEDRSSTYDKPAGERSMAATVEAFRAVTGDGLVSSEERGWLFMVLLKMVRSQQGALRMDSYEDGAAYCGLMGEAAARERDCQRQEGDE